VNENFWQTLPDEFEAEAYRSLHPDLTHMTDVQLLHHYKTYGREEGRTANRVRDRQSFSRLIPNTINALEIGPFCTPILRGLNVSYFDVLSQEDLVARAHSLGLDPAGIPNLDYTSPTGSLEVVERQFEVILSSHCLEHQPDLIHHLQQTRRLLQPEGAYFLLVPDKRYCLDHFIPSSNLAEVVAAHYERRTAHTLRSVIEHRALTTHNDSSHHWQGDHGTNFDNVKDRVEIALREFDDANGRYIDVHAWYFTPDSACAILSALHGMGLIKFSVRRVYPTRFGANEFWLVLYAECI
jgi:2-polyprenyl-3-methyl-5-hydroxy-6-metoxy-1,4-benzoquinol methylase